MNTPDRVKWIIEALQGEDLSGWEQGFVDNVQKQFEKRGTLTDPQAEKLEEIYYKKTQS